MDLLNRDEEERPWGRFERFTHNEPTTVKIIDMKPSSRLSYQYHNHRSEFWRVLSGNGVAVIDDEELPVKTGDEILIPQGTKHRMMTGDHPVSWLEISFGEFDEDDNIRLEDDYGRT